MSVEVNFRKSNDTFNVNINGCSNSVLPGSYFETEPVQCFQKDWRLRISPDTWKIELGCCNSSTATASYEIIVRYSGRILIALKIPSKHFTGSGVLSAFQRRDLTECKSYFYPDHLHSVHRSLKSMRHYENLQIVVRIVLYHPIEQTLRGPLESFAEKSKLTEHIADLSLSNDWTDVSIVGADGEVISAHKLILCARSSVFKAMFSNGMEETLSNVVSIPDMDTAVLRDMLTYVYTDRCPKETLEEHAEPLLAAACKYQLKGLESICAVYLSTIISTDNAAKIFHLSDALNSEQLKSFADKFLRDHRIAII